MKYNLLVDILTSTIMAQQFRGEVCIRNDYAIYRVDSAGVC